MKLPIWMCSLIFIISSPDMEAFKILVVSPFPSKSHVILSDGYVNILLDAGHEITYITAAPQNNSNPLLRQIDVSRNEKLMPPNFLNINAIINKELDTNDPRTFVQLFITIAKDTLEHEDVVEILLDSSQKFDVVIAEWAMSELYLGMSAVLDCPFIWFSTTEPHWMILQLIDEVTNPTYTASTLSPNMPPFTFEQRVKELFLQGFSYFLKEWSMYYDEEEFYRNYFGPIMAKRGKQLPPFNYIRFNASLVLGNSHTSLGQGGSLPQSYKSIAGYHINPNVKSLPKALRSLMDNATNGVIYFSMGTNLKSHHFPEQVKNKLIKVFGQLKQRVLWKFEEEFSDLPNNLHILKWAPQQSILSHPNCIMFITHGGLLSTTEAVHFGIPIIGIPVFGDQHINVKRSVNKGYALKVDLSYDMADDLDNAIQEMLSNPSYRNKAKELSYIYHHRVASPRAELIHWVEHVVETGGAPHLRSPALNVPWYQKMYLDFLAVVTALIFLSVIITKKLISWLFTRKNCLKPKIH